MKADLERLVDLMISRGVLFEEAIQEFEKRFILNMVERENHNLSKAAAALGIHRNTLSKRIHDYEKNNERNGYSRRQVAPRRKSRS
jgi:Fis family transcriptional regulator